MNDADIIQVRTYIRDARVRGFSAADVCFTIRYGAQLRPRSLGFAENSRTPFIGFPDSVPFFLTGSGTRRDESEGGKKEVEVHAGVDIDIWFRINGSNQIRSPIAGCQQRLRYNQNEFSTILLIVTM